MRLKTSPLQVQKPILAPAMQQSIAVLLLPIAELSTAIEQELQENPLLELNEEATESLEKTWEQHLKLRFEKPSYRAEEAPPQWSSDDDLPQEKTQTKEDSLEETLLQQLRIEFSDPTDIKIGELIIGNLNEDGYLHCSCEDIAQLCAINDMTRIENVLKKIQSFEPMGIASRNLKECLAAQVKIKCNGESELVLKIINEHLEDMGGKRYKQIAKNLGVSLEDIRHAAQLLATLEPRPARNYRQIAANTYFLPDIHIVENAEGCFSVEINAADVPTLKISPFYRKMIYRTDLTEQEKEFLNKKLKDALQFIRSIEQRHETLKKITEHILLKQKDFFTGDHMALVPMTLNDVALAVGRNESTICRAINSKYMETPKGLYPLKYFFSQEASASDNVTVTSRGVKEEIFELITTEDKNSPLSDQALVDHFKNRGMPIARRTITKYRQSLKILPSHLRKN